MNCSQLTFLATRPHSWRARRCSTLRTISQQRSQLPPGELNRAGWWWREAIELSIRTWNVGTPSGLIATRSKSQAPATQSTSRIPRKLLLWSKKQHVRSRNNSDSARSPHPPEGPSETSRNSVITKRRIFRFDQPQQIIQAARGQVWSVKKDKDLLLYRKVCVDKPL